MKELPPAALERFTRRVQPLLVNSCTTSGCHQPSGEQKFQLDRSVIYGLSNRRLTLRNLSATLALVNRQAPRQSELISLPQRVHGGMDRPIFGSRQEAQLKQLVEWVQLVTKTSAAPKPPLKFADVAATPISPLEPPELQQAPSRFLDPSIVAATLEGEDNKPLSPLPPKSPLKFGADVKPWRPKDEFDPEIFNRLQPQPAKAEDADGPFRSDG